MRSGKSNVLQDMLVLVPKIILAHVYMHMCHDEIYKFMLLSNVNAPNRQNAVEHAKSNELTDNKELLEVQMHGQ